MAHPKKLYYAGDVFLFIPNMIGYARIGCTAASIILMMVSPQQWVIAVLLYLMSFIGDLVDGYAARKFNQSSEFGGMLDMITDRCSTLGLLFALACEYRKPIQQHGGGPWALLYTSLAILDISSHWAQMFSTASLKLHHKSKEANAKRFFLVRWYYGNYPFFGYCCVGAEFTYITLYILAHASDPWIIRIVSMALTLFAPACFIKQIVNVFQLLSASHLVATSDADKRN